LGVRLRRFFVCHRRPQARNVKLEFIMETINLTIQGMSCGGCAAKVSNALKSLPGAKVKAVAVGSARISFDPKLTSTAAMVDAVNHLGFQATVT